MFMGDCGVQPPPSNIVIAVTRNYSLTREFDSCCEVTSKGFSHFPGHLHGLVLGHGVNCGYIPEKSYYIINQTTVRSNKE